MAWLPEIPALYDLAKRICHDMGMSWTDPRTGVTYPPPKKHQVTAACLHGTCPQCQARVDQLERKAKWPGST